MRFVVLVIVVLWLLYGVGLRWVWILVVDVGCGLVLWVCWFSV